MATTQDLKIRYTGDVSGVKKAAGEIDKAHQGLSSKLGAVSSKLKSVGAGMVSAGRSATIGLTLPIVGAGIAAFKLADDYGDAAATVQQHIKTMGAQGTVSFDQLAEGARTFSMATGIAQTEILGASGKLITFANVAKRGTGFIQETTQAAADLAASGFGNMSSASVMLGKALDNPLKGITALTRVGVSFNDQQVKTIQHLVETGNSAKAQGIILRAVQAQVGGTAKKIADPWDQAKASLQAAAITIGTQLAPFVAKLSQVVASVVAWFAKLSPSTQKVIGILLGVVAVLGPLLILFGKLASAIGTIGALFAEGGALAGVALWPIAVAAAVIILTVIIVKNWSKIKAFVLGVWHAIRDSAPFKIIAAIVMTYVRIIVAEFKILWAVVRVVFNGIKAVAIPVIKAIVAVFRTEFGIIKSVFQTVKGAIVDGWHLIKSVASDVWNGITSIVKTALNGVIRIWNDTIGALAHGQTLGAGPFHVTLPNLVIPELAAGGVVRKPTIALVGENGPEAVVPLPRGGRHGVGGMVVNVYVNGSVVAERDLAQTIRAELIRAARPAGGRVGLS